MNASSMLPQWTTADFDQLSWHDCHVHGFRLIHPNEQHGTCHLEFDIDFILEWLPQGGGGLLFRLAPATLTFHDVFGLRILLDYDTPRMAMTPFSLDGIEREPIPFPTGATSFRWLLPINSPAGQITFQSPGFTQILTGEPIVHQSQYLPENQRQRF